MQELIGVLRERLLEQIDLSREVEDEEILCMIEAEVQRQSRKQAMTLPERSMLRQAVFNSMRKLDVLQELLDDEEITEVMVNGSRSIFYEKRGRLYQWEKQFSSREKLADTIQQIVGMNNRMVNDSSPIVDTRLKDGSRVNIVLSPISIEGSTICIRKFPKNPLSMQRLIGLGALTKELADYLGLLVHSGYNIFISGGTGSGKTTFLNALAGYIPSGERLITIEDSAELQIRGIPNLVRMETRNANCEGTKAIEIRDLIRTALRMRPDRIIVGECRGAEALDMLQAMNTGHDGSLSTGHANSGADMLRRLETMVLMGMELPTEAIRRQIESGIDLIIHLGRLRDCTRKVLEVLEVDGIRENEIRLRSLWRFTEQEEKEGRIIGEWKCMNVLRHRGKLMAAGFEQQFAESERQAGCDREAGMVTA